MVMPHVSNQEAGEWCDSNKHKYWHNRKVNMVQVQFQICHVILKFNYLLPSMLLHAFY